ncbi:Flp pilus assembly protein CpaB [Eubacteriaceae bacterium ES2]|nr:Flp pilus assembly protein CpaB [Eubacteriaceae bacterium ES2]
MKKLVIIALILSLVAGFAVFQFTLSLQSQTDEESRPVVVAISDLEAATVIEQDMVELIDVPLDYVHPNSLNSLDQVVGRITKENIIAGEQILSTRLSDGNEESDGLTYAIPTGFRAVTLETDEFTGVGGYLQKGDRVDVVSTMITGQALTTQYVCENLEVLEVGAKTKKDTDEEYISVTVAVPKNEVLKLSYALTEGKYRIVLRSAVDQEYEYLEPFIP